MTSTIMGDPHDPIATSTFVISILTCRERGLPMLCEARRFRLCAACRMRASFHRHSSLASSSRGQKKNSTILNPILMSCTTWQRILAMVGDGPAAANAFVRAETARQQVGLRGDLLAKLMPGETFELQLSHDQTATLTPESLDLAGRSFENCTLTWTTFESWTMTSTDPLPRVRMVRRIASSVLCCFSRSPIGI